MIYESDFDRFTSPGGGLEENEALSECCIREIEEETGLLVTADTCFLKTSEFIDEWDWVNYYFICEVVGKGTQQLTEREIEIHSQPRWLSVQDALTIFSTYDQFANTDPSRRSLYCREYSALKHYLEMQQDTELS